MVPSRRRVKVCFTQGAIENSTLDAALEPQFNGFLEACLRLTNGTALRYNTDLRACSNAALSGFATHERLEVDFESYRFDHR